MKMRTKWLVLMGLLITLLLTAGAALAEEVTLLPVEQMGWILPLGMEEDESVTIATEPGLLEITIDDDKVNWANALASTGLGGSNAQIIWQVKAPASIEAGQNFVLMTYAENDADALDALHTAEERGQHRCIGLIDGWGVACEPTGMPHTENGAVVATAIAELGYLVPEGVEQIVYLGWYDSNRAPLSGLCYQKLTVRIRHTRTAAFETTVSNPAAADRIVGNAAGTAGVTVLEKKDGSISYMIPDGEATVQTKVLSTGAATHYSTMGNMKSGSAAAPQPLDGGYALTEFTSFGSVGSWTEIFFFCDADGRILETVSLNIGYQPGEELMAWPAYQDMGIFPLYADQLEIINSASVKGYTAVYSEDNGHLLCGYNGDQNTSSALENAVTLKVSKPGWDVSSYRIYEAASNALLGPAAGSLEGLQHALDQGYPKGAEALTDDVVYSDTYEPFKTIQPEDDSITLYVPDASASVPNYARLFIVEWNSDEGTDYQYFWMTTEPFTIVEETQAVTSESELEQPVQKPSVVGQPGWLLVVMRYHTDGDDAWHVDLMIRDQNGVQVIPDTPVQVYLPYPEGHQPGMRYVMHHYTDGLYDQTSTAYETLEMTDTDYGLMFETSSFSPFIYSAAEAEEPTPVPTSTPVPAPTVVPTSTPAPVSAVPKTGDTTPLALLLLLALCSVVGILAMKKTRAVR